MRIIEELNKGWQIQGFDREVKFEEVKEIKEGWLSAQVPGVVHLDLLRERKLADPFYDLKEKDAYWVEKKEWWYKNEFRLDRFDFQWKKKKKVELVFEGLDSFAIVYLNGEKIGEADNMFIPWRFDITDKIREENILLIKFSSAISVLKKIQAREGPLKAAFEPARVYGRKAQYCFGWDWGPRLPGVGIWRGAYICSYDEMRIDWVGAESKLLERKAQVKLDIEVFSNIDKEQIGKVLIYLDERCVKEENIKVKFPSSKYLLSLEIKDPILWYPKGYGDQHLYRLKVELLNKKEELMDIFQDKIGVREVQLIQKEEGNSFYFKVNGIPVFCKGANWIPADSFLPRVDKDRYALLIESASRCGINMFRVWGGGIYEDKEFYRLCDEKGIMVWQDFMFSCGEYPEKEWFWEKVKKEAEQVVKSLKNHPCIVLWCGNNENHWIYGNDDKLKGRTIYHNILPSICREIDPTRPYWPSSPYGGKDANSEEEGDRHNWYVWTRWKDIDFYKKDKGKFISEFGFQAPPVMETIKKFCPSDELKEDSPCIKWHNKQDDGPLRLIHYLKTYMPEPKDFEEFVQYTQLNQAHALRVMIEHCRRRKFECGGALFWQFNDCWPGVSWSVVDYYLQPKPSYYAVKRAFQPVIISLVEKEGLEEGLEVWICNDTLRKLKGKLQLKSMSFKGQILWTKEKDVFVPSNSSVKVLTKSIWEMGIKSREEDFVYACLKIEGGKVENHLFLERERNLKFPLRQFKRKIYQSEDGLKINLYSPVFVRSVALGVPGESVEFSDNFFDLIPGVEKEVRLTCSLEKEKKLRID